MAPLIKTNSTLILCSLIQDNYYIRFSSKLCFVWQEYFIYSIHMLNIYWERLDWNLTIFLTLEEETLNLHCINDISFIAENAMICKAQIKDFLFKKGTRITMKETKLMTVSLSLQQVAWQWSYWSGRYLLGSTINSK